MRPLGPEAPSCPPPQSPGAKNPFSLQSNFFCTFYTKISLKLGKSHPLYTQVSLDPKPVSLTTTHTAPLLLILVPDCPSH